MFEQVKTILSEDLQVEAASITEEAELIADLGINSLELADMILICEEKFNIEIKDEDIHGLLTVGDLVTYLEENVEH